MTYPTIITVETDLKRDFVHQVWDVTYPHLLELTGLLVILVGFVLLKGLVGTAGRSWWERRLVNDRKRERTEAVTENREAVFTIVDSLTKDLAASLRLSAKKSTVKSSNETPIVWSLLGAWGSGKTTIANKVVELLEDKSSEPPMKIIRFEPWLLVDNHDLYTEFLSALATAHGSSRARRIVRQLQRRSLAPVKSLPVVGDALDNLWTSQQISNEAAFDRLRSVFNGSRSNHFWRREQRHILVVVDDIDRLSAEEILTVMKLVKVVGNLEGVTYLLCYDEAIVHLLLSQTHLGSVHRAGEYLKKIVQHEVFVPVMRQSKEGVPKFLNEAAEYRALGLRGVYITSTYASLFRTPRDIQRYRDGFVAAVLALGSHPERKVNLHELALIELVRFADRPVYRSIVDNHVALASWDANERASARAVVLQVATKDRLIRSIVFDLYPASQSLGGAEKRSIDRAQYAARYFGLVDWDREFDHGQPCEKCYGRPVDDHVGPGSAPARSTTKSTIGVGVGLTRAVIQIDAMTANAHKSWSPQDRIAHFRMWSDVFQACSEREGAPMRSLSRRAVAYKFFADSTDKWEAVLDEAPQRWQFLLELAAAHLDANYGITYGQVDPTPRETVAKIVGLQRDDEPLFVHTRKVDSIPNLLIDLATARGFTVLREMHCVENRSTVASDPPDALANRLWLLTPLSLVEPGQTRLLIRELHDRWHGTTDTSAPLGKRKLLKHNEWKPEFKLELTIPNLRVDTYLGNEHTVRLHSDSVFRNIFRTSCTYMDFQTVGTDLAARKRIAELMVLQDAAPCFIASGEYGGNSDREGELVIESHSPSYVSVDIGREALRVWDREKMSLQSVEEDHCNIAGTREALNRTILGHSIRELVIAECARLLELDMDDKARQKAFADKQASGSASTPPVVDLRSKTPV
jgi:KAP family P-loop domain